jgi:hypothetical protein
MPFNSFYEIYVMFVGFVLCAAGGYGFYVILKGDDDDYR